MSDDCCAQMSVSFRQGERSGRSILRGPAVPLHMHELVLADFSMTAAAIVSLMTGTCGACPQTLGACAPQQPFWLYEVGGAAPSPLQPDVISRGEQQ